MKYLAVQRPAVKPVFGISFSASVLKFVAFHRPVSQYPSWFDFRGPSPVTIHQADKSFLESHLGNEDNGASILLPQRSSIAIMHPQLKQPQNLKGLLFVHWLSCRVTREDTIQCEYTSKPSICTNSSTFNYHNDSTEKNRSCIQN